MKINEFLYWLRGFIDASGPYGLTIEQTKILSKKIDSAIKLNDITSIHTTNKAFDKALAGIDFQKEHQRMVEELKESHRDV